MSNLSKITKEHVELAISDLNAGSQGAFKPTSKFKMVYDGKLYAPKMVVEYALRHLDGTKSKYRDFYGGWGSQGANTVLNNLGYEIVETGTQSSPTMQIQGDFITSRGHSLPTTQTEMLNGVWYNAWKTRQQPYQNLKIDSLLYWYDNTLRQVVWKSRVSAVDVFKYSNKTEIKQRGKAFFSREIEEIPYFTSRPDSGYCLLFKVQDLQRVNIAYPDIELPQNGWLQITSLEMQKRLAVPNPDGPFGPELKEIESDLRQDKAFSNDEPDPAREIEKRLVEIALRRGQSDFRNQLMLAYQNKCAITGCDAMAALEAAHIIPYSKGGSNSVCNGLLLRGDIHTLFDLNLIAIDPDNKTIVLAEQLRNTSYQLHNSAPLSLPSTQEAHPSDEALRNRWDEFKVNSERR